ncbi:MAG: dTDP-glucose 4,6-dehydratase [Nitrospirae bacterium]|nr:dTDP-glucose 4,6-dehydratase [Nitrospirota bacterium]
MMRLLITGGCGFIGSNFIRHIVNKYPDYEITNLDALTYAGNTENLKDIKDKQGYSFIYGRIEDSSSVRDLMREADCVVNFAAESHVDRSIADAQPFLMTNVIGTYVLLEAARTTPIKKFIHISTDEIYGELGNDGKFTEDTPLRPNSPYSASKASGDMLVRAYHETYKIPSIIIRPSNNYGPFQFPEKFIPLMITNLLQDKPVPVYGKGENIRDWLFVDDCCTAIDVILHNGETGEAYNVGGNGERKNIEIAGMILELLGKDRSHIKYVQDRPGHDYRYALDNSKIESRLKWRPSVKVEEGIKRTVQWYKGNEWWWKPLKERLAAESKGFWEKS